jgi:16S rRNA U516 pseudouridylate synthase RsuA-like enzyme
MIDSSEDLLRRRLKFRRNPYGSRHEVATQIAFGRVASDDTESVESGITTENSDDKIAAQNRSAILLTPPIYLMLCQPPLHQQLFKPLEGSAQVPNETEPTSRRND